MRPHRAFGSALLVATVVPLAPARATDPCLAARPCPRWAAALAGDTASASATTPDGRLVAHATWLDGASRRLRIAAHAAASGTALWSRDVPVLARTGDVTLSASGRAVHAVVQHLGDGAASGARDGDVTILTLDAATGRVTRRVTYAMGGEILLRAAVTPAGDGAVLVTMPRDARRPSLTAHYVSATRRAVGWRAAVPGQDTVSSVVVRRDGRAAYVVGDRYAADGLRGSVVAFALRSADRPVQWRRDLGRHVVPADTLVSADDRTLYVGLDVVGDPVTGRAYRVDAVSTATGALAWSTTLPRSPAVGVLPSVPPMVYVGWVAMRLVDAAPLRGVYAVVATSRYGTLEAPYDSYAVVRLTPNGAVDWTTDVLTSAAHFAAADPAGHGVVVAGPPAGTGGAATGVASAVVTRVGGDGVVRSTAAVAPDQPTGTWQVSAATVAADTLVLSGYAGTQRTLVAGYRLG